MLKELLTTIHNFGWLLYHYGDDDAAVNQKRNY